MIFLVKHNGDFIMVDGDGNRSSRGELDPHRCAARAREIVHKQLVQNPDLCVLNRFSPAGHMRLLSFFSSRRTFVSHCASSPFVFDRCTSAFPLWIGMGLP